MSYTSLIFLIFVAVAAIGYYLIPKKFQQVWLLFFSYLYYLSAGGKIIFFILFSTGTTFFGGLLLERISQAELPKKRIQSRKRTVLILLLFMNFGVLAFVKYTNFIIDNINALTGGKIEALNILLPLGISFYTFQAAGYILDLYWGRCQAERNPVRYALFISFFPQIMQGPIGRFSKLAHQFGEAHEFSPERTEKALMRIGLGFFKKMVLADGAAFFADAVFDGYIKNGGMGILGVLAYSAQLYGDFSGGIDIAIGIGELFGIEMDENFRQPYFAVSITDFWHRWHITLGTWMRDYVFYPVSLSGWMSKFAKFCRKKMGKNVGHALPVAIANILVFLLVGVWHGPAWHYIVYGLYNGLIIGISGLLIKNFRSWRAALHITESTRWFHVFQIIRTFLLVNISWFFDRSGSLEQAFRMIGDSFTKFDYKPLFGVLQDTAGFGSAAEIWFTIFAVAVSAVLVFSIDLLEEKKISVRDAILRRPAILRIAIYCAFLFLIPCLGHPPSANGGFIYANF